jgi:hypothetical protein
MKERLMPTNQEIREQGIGSNFSVLNPEDGYRKDNSLWFGNCSECGERVSQSLHHDYWQHTKFLEKGYGSKQQWEENRWHSQATSTGLDYCPTAKGEPDTCVVWYYDENNEKVFVS